jgi:hypothetical protein
MIVENYIQLYFFSDRLIRKKTLTGKPLVYLGYEFEIKRKLLIGDCLFYDISELLENVVDNLKFDFIDYVTNLGQDQKDISVWWSTKLASKSNFQTDFYSRLCMLEVANELLKKHLTINVVCNDPQIFNLIRLNLETKSLLINRLNAFFKNFQARFILNIKLLPRRVYFILGHYKYSKKAKSLLVHEIGNSKINYIYSWIENRTFDKDGNFNEIYLKGLSDFKAKDPFMTFCPNSTKIEYYHRLNLIQHKATGLAVFSRKFYPFKLINKFVRFNLNLKFNSYNLKNILSYENLIENSYASFLTIRKDYESWLDFFASASGNLFYPFENQPWEKIMLLAARKNNTQVKTIGYHHISIHKMLLSNYSTEKELTYLPLPDILITNSQTNLVHYKAQFKEKTHVMDGGALRAPVMNKLSQRKTNVIGVMLSTMRTSTMELIYNLINNNIKSYKFLVKPHPDLPVDDSEFPENVMLYKDSLDTFYASVDAVVYSNSTAGIEAYSLGLPVFRFVTQVIDFKSGELDFSPIAIKSYEEITNYNLTKEKQRNVFSPINLSLWEEVLNY